MEAFRGQPDALQQAAARKHPRQPQPHADGAGGMGKKGGAERPQPAVEATRQRDLQQGAITAEPARLEAGRREVGAAVIAEIGERHDTDVDPVAERLEDAGGGRTDRSEEHTSELQSLMRISYAVFCLEK